MELKLSDGIKDPFQLTIAAQTPYQSKNSSVVIEFLVMKIFYTISTLMVMCLLTFPTSAQITVNGKVSIEQLVGERLVLKTYNFYDDVLEFEYYIPFKHRPRHSGPGHRVFEFKEDGSMAYEDTTEIYDCGNDHRILFFRDAHWESLHGNTFKLTFKGGIWEYPYEKAVIIYHLYSTPERSFVFKKMKVEKANEMSMDELFKG